MRPIRPSGNAKHVKYRFSLRTGRLVPVALLLLFLTLAGCAAGRPVGSRSTAQAAAPSPTPPPVTYVAIGASDALGVGADDPATQGYVPLLITRLPKGSAVLNVGVSGILLHDALQQELPEAIAFHPTLVTVWLVGNDFRDCTPLSRYAFDLNTLLAKLQSKTHARVFVANTPDMSLLPYFSQEHGAGGGACVEGASTAYIRGLALRWNAVINPIVLRHSDVLVDLYHTDLASHPSYISSDGFHPSSQGYAQLASLFWAEITANRAVPAAG